MLRKLEKALENGCVFSVVGPENPVRICENHQMQMTVDSKIDVIVPISRFMAFAEEVIPVLRSTKFALLLDVRHSILIENLGETLEAVLTPVIQRAVIYRGRKMYIKLGDSEVEFHPDFRWVPQRTVRF